MRKRIGYLRPLRLAPRVGYLRLLRLAERGSVVAVRVKVRLRSRGREVETSALANTGFESDREEVLLPMMLAERLGLWPPPPGSSTETYVSASGYMRALRVPEALEVSVVTEEGERGRVKADAVVAEFADEVLLNDKTISALRIVLEDPGGGLWRFRGEEKLRRTERPQRWLGSVDQAGIE